MGVAQPGVYLQGSLLLCFIGLFQTAVGLREEILARLQDCGAVAGKRTGHSIGQGVLCSNAA